MPVPCVYTSSFLRDTRKQRQVGDRGDVDDDRQKAVNVPILSVQRAVGNGPYLFTTRIRLTNSPKMGFREIRSFCLLCISLSEQSLNSLAISC